MDPPSRFDSTSLCVSIKPAPIIVRRIDWNRYIYKERKKRKNGNGSIESKVESGTSGIFVRLYANCARHCRRCLNKSSWPFFPGEKEKKERERERGFSSSSEIEEISETFIVQRYNVSSSVIRKFSGSSYSRNRNRGRDEYRCNFTESWKVIRKEKSDQLGDNFSFPWLKILSFP